MNAPQAPDAHAIVRFANLTGDQWKPARADEYLPMIDPSTRIVFAEIAALESRDGGKPARQARAMRCGQVFVNGFGAAGGIELPFGGVKKSGHGREKGFEALYEFTTIKTIVLNHG